MCAHQYEGGSLLAYKLSRLNQPGPQLSHAETLGLFFVVSAFCVQHVNPFDDASCLVNSFDRVSPNKRISVVNMDRSHLGRNSWPEERMDVRGVESCGSYVCTLELRVEPILHDRVSK